MQLVDRLSRSIKMRPGHVVLRSDVAGLGSPSQLTAAFRVLQERGVVTRIGKGIYAKTRVSSATGAVIPAGSLETLAAEALQRLGVPVAPGRDAARYNAGLSTQLPGRLIVNTGQRRISRKIEVGSRRIAYENDFGRTAATAGGPRG